MQKSNQKSQNLRQEGNEYYKNKKFLPAILKYNQSLCFAENESENLGHAYANRSAIYFEMKQYDKCLSNIENAVKNFYPKESIEVLNKRRLKSLECMIHQDDKRGEIKFKLCQPPKRKLPFIIDGLKLKNDVKYGRHIITTNNLSVGDVIAIERPIVCVPIIESNFLKVPEFNNYQRCNNCLFDNLLDLIPCDLCCEGMYCGINLMHFDTAIVFLLIFCSYSYVLFK